MPTNRLFALFVVAIAVVVVFAARTALASTNPNYHQSAQEALREYVLGEKYGVVPQGPAQFTPDQILREYILGERYGVTP